MSEIYRVVVNDEEQYSVWPDGRPRPQGWHDAGVAGSKQECLDHIERVWTDMRPRSVREARPEGSAGSEGSGGSGGGAGD